MCGIAHMVHYCLTWFLFHDMLFEVMNRHSAAHTQYRNTSLLTRTNHTTHAAACNCENKGNGILRARRQRSSFSCAQRRQSHEQSRQKPRLLCYAHPGAPRNRRKQLGMMFIISQMKTLIQTAEEKCLASTSTPFQHTNKTAKVFDAIRLTQLQADAPGAVRRD